MTENHKITFENNTFLYGMYKEVVNKGGKPEEMDTGWEVMNYDKPGELNQAVPGKASDGTVEPQEFAGYLAADPKKYHEELEKIIGNKVAWTLDDYDDQTDYDRQYRERVQNAGGFLDKLLTDKGLNKDDDRYQLSKAWGMFFFTVCPKFSEVQNDSKFLDFVRQKLKESGIPEFEKYLVENDGLDLYTFDSLSPQDGELSALEALRQRKGNCTEKANILYAVFNEVELPVSLLEVFPVRSVVADRDIFDNWFSLPETSIEGHLAVGLSVGGKLVYFDATGHFYDKSPPKYFFPVPMKDMSRMAAMNYMGYEIGGDKFEAIEAEKANELLSRLEILRSFGSDSMCYFIDDYIAGLMLKIDKCESAMQFINEAIEINPHYIGSRMNKASLNAICNNDPSVFESEMKELYYQYPFFALVRDAYIGYLVKDRREFEVAAKELEKGVEMYPNYSPMQVELAEMYYNLRQYENALKVLEKAIERKPDDLMLYHHAAVACWSDGKTKEAWKYLKTLNEKAASFLKEYEVFTVDNYEQVMHIQSLIPLDMAAVMPEDVKMTMYNLYTEMGLRLLKNGDTIQALASFSNIRREEYPDQRLYKGLHDAYIQVGNKERADEIAMEYRTLTGKDLFK